MYYIIWQFYDLYKTKRSYKANTRPIASFVRKPYLLTSAGLLALSGEWYATLKKNVDVYLNKERKERQIERAVDYMIKNYGKRITADALYFSKLLKRTCGMTPSRY